MDNMLMVGQAPASKRHMIHFSGPINPATVHNLKAVTIQALQQNPSCIYYAFSSEGGDVNSGIALYNFLRGIRIPFCMHGMACVESIATLIFLAADERYIVDSGRFLIHSFSANGIQQTLSPYTLSERSRSIDNHMDIYAKCFEERTKGAEAPIDIRKALCGEALIVDASAAVASGLAHKVVPPDGLITADDTHWWAAP